MKRITKFTVYALTWISLLIAQKGQAQLADSPWSTFQHDAQRTGRSPYVGPAQANLAWTRDRAYNPIIGPNSTIYVRSDADYQSPSLLALNIDGSIKWEFKGTLWPQAVDKNGISYCTSSDSNLYALNPEGSLRWKSNVGPGYSDAVAAIDGQGDIYVSNRRSLSRVDANGNLQWQFPKNPIDSFWISRKTVAISADGTIYIADSEGLKAISPDGILKWTYSLGIFEKATGAISIGTDSTIYIGTETTFSSDNQLYALRPNGSLKWAFSIGDYSTAIRSAPAIGADGTIYAGFGEGRNNPGGLLAINPDGTLKWIYRSLCFTGSPIIGADGTIYAASEDGYLYSFKPDSTVYWKHYFGKPWVPFSNFSYLAIDSLGTLYFGDNDTYGPKLHAFFRAEGGTPDLTITSEGIAFDHPSLTVSPNDTVKINISVLETSNSQSAAFDVLFYRENEDNKIDSVHAWALSGGITTVQGVWNTSKLEAKTYNIIVKVKNSIPRESNLHNNDAQATYTFLPFIQDRIDAAQSRDTVRVESGTYYENIHLKSGVVVKSRMGATRTIIDGKRKGSVVTADSSDASATLDGFTITNGFTYSSGGGINIGRDYFGDGAATIINNIITGNEAWAGGGIHLYRSPSSIIRNNLVIDNKADLGAGIYSGQSWCIIHNNTIVNNQGTGIEARGYPGMSPDIRNSIIWGNKDDLSMIAFAYYSDVQNAPADLIKTGSISIDPLFVNPDTGNYDLTVGSPCIDAGDPTSPRDPDGTRSDMGAYYFDQSATIARIVGNLVDAVTGAPITLAKVYLRGPKNDLVAPDVQGHYVFAVPTDTGYVVEVFAPNHASARQENISTRVGEATEVNFLLTPHPTEITLFPPTNLQGAFEESKVRLTWQRPKEELAFDDGFYEAAVGFSDQQGVLAAGPFKPAVYPARIEKIKVAFDGERAGDKIDLTIYLDPAGTAPKPSAAQLVSTQQNVPIQVGGGFLEVDVSGEGITLNSGAFFIGIKQVNILPMYLLLDQSEANGHSFCDDDLDGTFDDLSSQGIDGALAIRTIVSMPSTGGGMAASKAILPYVKPSKTAMPSSLRTSLAEDRKNPGGLVSKSIVSSKSEAVATAEQDALSLLANPPQSVRLYRSETSPVEISDANKIATLAGSATSYDDMSLGSAQCYYYVVAARYATGDNIPSDEVAVDIVTGVGEPLTHKIPEKFELAQNWPNPFNPVTVIQYQLPKQAEVRLEIYNILGDVVNTLVSKSQSAGYYTVRWNGKDDQGRPVASGVYLYSLRAGEFVQVRKMILVR